MANTSSTTLILVAGGKGTRMASAIPKQFLPLQGKPVLYHPVNTFLKVFPDIDIILVLPEEHLSYGNMLLQAFEQSIDLTMVRGGATRFHSVQNGLKAMNNTDIVFIHDGVRPLADIALIQRCYLSAQQYGSAIPAMPVTDSIRQWDGSTFRSVDRDGLRSIQTPQTFRSELIRSAFEQEYQELFTDEASVVEALGEKVHLVEGAARNIKITRPEDLIIAELLMQQPNDD